jgi:hypothetical protein
MLILRVAPTLRARSLSVRSHIETCEHKAAECEQFARRVRDPAARRIFQRAADRWRRMVDDSDDRLSRLIPLLAPLPATDNER